MVVVLKNLSKDLMKLCILWSNCCSVEYLDTQTKCLHRLSVNSQDTFTPRGVSGDTF